MEIHSINGIDYVLKSDIVVQTSKDDQDKINKLTLELERLTSESERLAGERRRINLAKDLYTYVDKHYNNLNDKDKATLIDLCTVQELTTKNEREIHQIYKRIAPALGTRIKGIIKRNFMR
ncbi:hypothetical protein ETI01_10670 [Macrococcoides caseolyticum]|uniref:hypothetical protein n=1 Tax=Macrococcoides caseolyticum TaxID=69966 RepID=UPI00105B3350|nr:hypothetical protein [Macrococcus caseolyticus]TDM20993.1 hypothetical protein ETI01_10670 [Macrococcus caseolyticus]